MVHVEIGRSNAGLLQVAGDLARRFDAGVIGIAACQPMQIPYGDGYISPDLAEEDFKRIGEEIKAAEAEFRGALGARISRVEWRSTVTLDPLSDYLAQAARSTDLVLTGVDRNGTLFDMSRHLDIGDLVMRVGRPVLIVPTAADKVGLTRIVVAWKDTRETRRAIADALPLLKKAAFVAVVEIAAESALPAVRSHLAEVVGWLERHGVVAQAVAASSVGEDAQQLGEIALEQKADLIVAGAYGHSRMREWMLGGVTRDLLLRADRCSLVSH